MKPRRTDDLSGRVLTLLMTGGALVMLFPFGWMTAAAFIRPSDLYGGSGIHFTLANFKTLFSLVPFGRFFFNSLMTAAVCVAGTLVVSSLAAYALTWIRLPFKRQMRDFLLLSLAVPSIALLLPLYLGASRLGLADTYAGLAIPQMNIAFSTLFLSRFFAAVPGELVAMAKLDRCSHLQILRYVMLPSCKGPYAAAAFFTFLTSWKSYLWPLMITSDTRHRTLPVGLKYMLNESASDFTAVMAAALLVCLPALIILIRMQKTLSGIAPSAELNDTGD